MDYECNFAAVAFIFGLGVIAGYALLFVALAMFHGADPPKEP
jgi:hypothetical protein